MKLEKIREYCLSKKGVTESFPFDDVTLVLKVGSKMFGLFNVNSEKSTMNLKCDPVIAEFLREKYSDDIKPGYHMNKKHWNTVNVESSVIPENEIIVMIDNSYDLVFKGLKKIEKDEILKF